MSMKHLLIIICLFSFHQGFSQESCSLKKRELKVANRLFDSDIETEVINISENLASSLENYNDGDCIYIIKREALPLAYLLSTKAKGRFDYFDYIVIYSADLTVEGISVIVYRSTNGMGICQKKWLSQFEGYNGGALELGPDIDAVSGGTISATSIVKDIQRCHLLLSSIEAE